MSAALSVLFAAATATLDICGGVAADFVSTPILRGYFVVDLPLRASIES